jgi:hypothetical protein
MPVFPERQLYVAPRGLAMVLEGKAEHAQQCQCSSVYHLRGSNEKTRHHDEEADGHERGHEDGDGM